MKTRLILISAFIAVFTVSSFAQLKVDPYGRIGIGTNWPNPGYKCHIKGDLLLTTHPDYPFIELQFKVGPLLNAQIGTNTDEVTFYSNWVNYHKLFAEEYYRLSDEKYKLNRTLISNPVERLQALKAYKYDMIDTYFDNETGDSLSKLIPKFGFIAQEIEEVLPDIKITKDIGNNKLMDYDQIIPLLVAGMQEQQRQIGALEVIISELTIKEKSLWNKEIIKDSISSSKIV